jgi:hypothetical protein
MGDEQIMKKLKPCPFCGGIPHYKTFMYYHELGKRKRAHNIVCVCGIGRGADTKEEVIEAWNKRSDQGSPVSPVSVER